MSNESVGEVTGTCHVNETIFSVSERFIVSVHFHPPGISNAQTGDHDA